MAQRDRQLHTVATTNHGNVLPRPGFRIRCSRQHLAWAVNSFERSVGQYFYFLSCS